MNQKSPEGLISRAREFFTANPDEELDLPTFMVKFDCTYRHAQYAVQKLRDEDLIESVHVIRNRAKGIASNPPPAEAAEVS